MTYKYYFDFDGGIHDENGNFIADSPSIFIENEKGTFMEVFEEPDSTVEFPNTQQDHWKLSDDSLVPSLLEYLNNQKRKTEPSSLSSEELEELE